MNSRESYMQADVNLMISLRFVPRWDIIASKYL